MNLKITIASLFICCLLFTSCSDKEKVEVVESVDTFKSLTESPWNMVTMEYSTYENDVLIDSEIESFGPNTELGYCTLIFTEDNTFYMDDSEEPFDESEIEDDFFVSFEFSGNSILLEDGEGVMLIELIDEDNLILTNESLEGNMLYANRVVLNKENL